MATQSRQAEEELLDTFQRAGKAWRVRDHWTRTLCAAADKADASGGMSKAHKSVLDLMILRRDGEICLLFGWSSIL